MLLRIMVGLPVLLVDGRGAVFTAVPSMQFLPVSVVLAWRRVPAPHACALSFPFMPPPVFSVRDEFSLPLARRISLPLEGPPPVLLSLLTASVASVAGRPAVQLEGACAASPSDVLLDVSEVVVGSHLWRTQTGRRQPA